MGTFELPASERLASYCTTHALVLGQRLGFGKDGTVWFTDRSSVLKVFERDHAYVRERDVYLRLRSLGVDQAAGHAVPTLRRYDDALGVIEMTIVRPPFVLDFASAQLDEPYDFPPDILAEWYEKKRRDFGPHWGRAVAVLRELERMGIYMVDVHPGNIGFPRAAGERRAVSSSSS